MLFRSKPLKACYLDENGKELPIVMGSYGIGPARVAAAAVEQNYDDDGIIWPRSISPLDVIVLPLNMNDPKTGEISEQLYTDLRKHGLKVLLDDRPERAGVKFKDSDLIGLPTQVIIGERGLREGVIEIKDRRTKEKSLVRVEEALQKIIKTVKT